MDLIEHSLTLILWDWITRYISCRFVYIMPRELSFSIIVKLRCRRCTEGCHTNCIVGSTTWSKYGERRCVWQQSSRIDRWRRYNTPILTYWVIFKNYNAINVCSLCKLKQLELIWLNAVVASLMKEIYMRASFSLSHITVDLLSWAC